MRTKQDENLRAYYVALAAIYEDMNDNQFCTVGFRRMAEKYRLPFHTHKEIRAAIDWACFVELEKVGSEYAADYLRAAMDN